MGFHKPMDYVSIKQQIHRAASELNSPYNDGFNQWEIKKDLYRLKWLLDDILKRTVSFEGEEEFIEQHSKETVWKAIRS